MKKTFNKIIIIILVVISIIVLYSLIPKAATIKTIDFKNDESTLLQLTDFNGPIYRIDNMERSNFEVRAEFYKKGQLVEDRLLYNNVFSGKKGLIGFSRIDINEPNIEKYNSYLYISHLIYIDETNPFKKNKEFIQGGSYINLHELLPNTESTSGTCTISINEKIEFNKKYIVSYFYYGNELENPVKIYSKYDIPFEDIVAIYLKFYK